MIDPILGIDTWEGQLEIDEAVLKANGVAFIFVRLNNMSGGHHKDTGFDKQWSEAKNFYRAPYFVYNPWVTGQENFNWLNANMPTDAKAVALDIEVSKAGYAPATYAAEVQKFINLVAWKWNYVIYTGEWFLANLAAWEKDADYWWAQYPYEFYPAGTLKLTWTELRSKLFWYAGPANSSKVPGRLKFWQFSGDRLILPGNMREMDVNVFFGSLAQLEAFMGGTPTTVPPAETRSQPYPGVEHYEGTAYGWKYFVQVIDPGQVRYEVVNANPRETVSSVAKRKGASIATNGGEWDRLTGGVKNISGAPFIKFNPLQIDHIDNIGTRITGLRYILQNGVLPTYLFGSEAQYTEGHSRTIEGVTLSGKHVQMVSEGAYPNQGLKLREAAEIMQSYGVITAFDSGGGGDSTLYMDGKVYNIPEDMAGGVHYERAIPEILLIYPKTGATPMADYYEYTTTASRAIRTGAGANFPRIESGGSNSYFNTNTVARGGATAADSYSLPADIYSGTVRIGMKGDTWVRLYENNGKPCDGWTALTHLGVPQIAGRLVTVTPPPVPTVPSVFITHDFTDTLTINGQKYTATFTVPNVEYKPQA